MMNLKEELGRGGFGTVSLAIDQLTRRKVAIKVLNERETTSQELIIKEIQAIALLDHPNIISFYHHFMNDGRLYLVMEYCSRGSLKYELIVKRNASGYSEDEACLFGARIAEGLEYVHNKGIVHHDIKTENILFSENGSIKISDFGVANTMGGTRAYMPPELFMENLSLEKDPRIDIYSLGITLLEIVLTQNPLLWIRDSQEQLIKKLDQSFIPNYLPHWFAEIIIKATHPNRELRFQSMHEFREALIAKTVPFELNLSLIKSNKIAESAAKFLRTKKWNKSFHFIEAALSISPKSVMAYIVGGKYFLKINNSKKAFEFLNNALRLNPRIDIQKELAWIHLQQENYPQAVSLLHDHIERHPLDKEAYCLLTEALFYMKRFNEGTEILQEITKTFKDDFFINNLFIMSIGSNKENDNFLKKYFAQIEINPFLEFNFEVLRLRNNLVNNTKAFEIIKKFLFQDYRFSNYTKHNTIVIEIGENKSYEFDKFIITIGRNNSNDLYIADTNCSRLHCVIINFPNDVWIQDMSSIAGVIVDGEKVTNKRFILGIHEIQLANTTLKISTQKELLV
ncbi:MAG: protein kinase [Bacteroidota bacterium]